MICLAALEGSLTTGDVCTAIKRERERRPGAPAADLAEWVVEQELWPRRTALVELLQHRNVERVRLIVCSAAPTEVLQAFSRRLRAEALPVTPGPAGRWARQVRRYLHGQPLDYVFTASLDDLPLLDLAARPCAVNPDRPLLTYARSRAWRILNLAPSEAPINELFQW